MIEDSTTDHDALFTELVSAGAWLNTAIFALRPIHGMGCGAVALTDIPAHTPVFHIPLHFILSQYTSDVRSLLTDAEWDSLGDGWAALILAMMWETEKGVRSRWCAYLRNMPVHFETPMFWSEEERQELVGTDIENRIGREGAEADYRGKLVPLIKAHNEHFPANSLNFSLQAYHVHGSRILSRSFMISKHQAGSSMNDLVEKETKDEEDEEDGDNEDDEEVAVMIPMADMLNAACVRDNARLFDEEYDHADVQGLPPSLGQGFTMVTTKVIGAGDQIVRLNTYASPPNSELLRKYGHVDILPLEPETLSLLLEDEIGLWPNGNPSDEVQINGKTVVRVIAEHTRSSIPDWEAGIQGRVDFWLEDGQDDTFTLSILEPVESALVAFVRILLFEYEWSRFEKKGKLPTIEIDSEVAAVLDRAILEREARYSGTLEHDLRILLADPPRPPYQYKSAAVRVGERRILRRARRHVKERMEDAMPDTVIRLKRRANESEIFSAQERAPHTPHSPHIRSKAHLI